MIDLTKEPLMLLNEWSRKYYQFTIQTGDFIQPGDGYYVVLKAGDRKVEVGDCELVSGPDSDIWPSLGDCIREAIRRWHADTTLKNFEVLWRPQTKYDSLGHLSNWRWHDVNKTEILGCIRAISEEAAIAVILSIYDANDQPTIIRAWEMTKDWTH